MTAPLGRVSELMGRSAEHVLHYYDAAINVMLLPLEIIATIAILIWFAGAAALGALVITLAVIASTHWFGKPLQQAATAKGDAMARYSSALNEVLVGIMTIRLVRGPSSSRL